MNVCVGLEDQLKKIYSQLHWQYNVGTIRVLACSRSRGGKGHNAIIHCVMEPSRDWFWSSHNCEQLTECLSKEYAIYSIDFLKTKGVIRLHIGDLF